MHNQLGIRSTLLLHSAGSIYRKKFGEHQKVGKERIETHMTLCNTSLTESMLRERKETK